MKTESPEAFAIKPFFRHFYGLYGERLNEVRSAANGSMEVFVHSHYSCDTPSADLTLDEKQYFWTLDERLEAVSKRGAPTLLLIEQTNDPYKNAKILRRYLLAYKTYASPGNWPVFYLPTFHDESTPCTTNASRQLNSPGSLMGNMEFSAPGEWDKLAAKLAGIGVSNISLSGEVYGELPARKQNLSLWQEDYLKVAVPKHGFDDCLLFPHGCVGIAMRNLQLRGFEVALSPAVLRFC